ncbi:hypothetical protein DDB_G0292894 [Dictyostelium discoideum AX4]|uniref:Uncharacterized cyclodeaminase n=1 Tax=Dictyostelium discoideum TaxID=44689 RepID=OCDL_DICDI|nr:hypothetical protein DDB_G0292894 [Dictyostelium discoideum AX4]Q54CJ8.1 RecName: Full=Uncharacterized cyclodeaminase [Dictyostelium discoideum]EAL60996.1 hypothetical protein DDB_G0292894 [Dictyostelium discoideum AX4]|eukprot:XP_629418.1 hypothetical protein DDB_G0292894 [Dictyostelium discoideum AX4]
MLIIKESDVKKLISLKEVIDINEQVFIKESKEEVVCPERIILPVEKTQPQQDSNEPINKKQLVGNLYFKPSLVVDESVGIKIVGTFANNANKGLPTVPATIILNDIETGLANAVIGATYITGARTAAGSAISVKYLATESPETIFVFGSSLQAQLHIEMILLLKPTIKKVYISSRSKENVDKLIIQLKNENNYNNDAVEFNYCAATGAGDDKDIINRYLLEADIIVTATSSNEPLFNGHEVLSEKQRDFKKKPLLICAVGSSRPTNRELDSFTISNSNLIVDDVNSCMVSGELFIPINKENIITKSHILGKLSDVVSGKYKQQTTTTTSKSITVYKSSGTAIQDVATANYIYKKALQNNIGYNININD